MKHSKNIQAATLTYIHTGGIIRDYIEIFDEEELKSINFDFHVIGVGTNTLIRCKGMEHPVIRMRGLFQEISNISEDILIAGSGVSNIDFARYATKQSLSGAEFMVGIPGGIGGGVKMNAGCFGSCFADIVQWIDVYRDKSIIRLMKHEIGFSYRKSLIRRNDIILRCCFKLNVDDPVNIKSRITEIRKLRMQKQPTSQYTFGSTFKNYDGGHSAILLEKAGLKGFQYGGAMFSDIHSNFIVHSGDATATDIEHLIGIAERKVYDMFNIALEKEVVIIGAK